MCCTKIIKHVQRLWPRFSYTGRRPFWNADVVVCPMQYIAWDRIYQTVNDGVAHSKNPRKCAYHVTLDLDLDLDACWPGVHLVKVWWWSGHLSARRSDLRKSLQTDGRTDRQTDRRRTPRHCISSFLEWAKNLLRRVSWCVCVCARDFEIKYLENVSLRDTASVSMKNQ